MLTSTPRARNRQTPEARTLHVQETHRSDSRSKGIFGRRASSCKPLAPVFLFPLWFTLTFSTLPFCISRSPPLSLSPAVLGRAESDRRRHERGRAMAHARWGFSRLGTGRRKRDSFLFPKPARRVYCRAFLPFPDSSRVLSIRDIYLNDPTNKDAGLIENWSSKRCSKRQ